MLAKVILAHTLNGKGERTIKQTAWYIAFQEKVIFRLSIILINKISNMREGKEDLIVIRWMKFRLGQRSISSG